MAHSDLSRLSIAVDAEPNLLANGVAAKGGLKFPWGAHRVVIDGDDAIPLLHAIGCKLTSGPWRGPKRNAALVGLSEAGPAPAGRSHPSRPGAPESSLKSVGLQAQMQA